MMPKQQHGFYLMCFMKNLKEKKKDELSVGI